MRLIVTRETSPYCNLALEEALLDMLREDTILLWRNAPSVIIGRHQNTRTEVNMALAAQLGIPVVRRLTGGGAVYHDLGNLNVSFLFRDGDIDRKAADCAGLLAKMLGELGVRVEPTGRNDLCLVESGRKLAGTAMLQREDKGLFHCCMLFDADREMMQKLLTPSTEKLRSKGVISVRGRTQNLCPLLHGKTVSADDFFVWVEQWFALHFGAQPDAVSEAENALAKKLQRERYESWTWNAGRDPAGEWTSAYRFAIGQVELHMSICKGRIAYCRFAGDFLSVCSIERLAQALEGVPFEEDAIREVLNAFAIEEIFQGEKREDVLRFLMGGV